MRYTLAMSAVLATAVSGVSATCSEEKGNWYCDSVEAISYSNFGTPGTFSEITTMANGVCGSSPESYSGGMSPMDGEVSWHFRGPMHLKQFAFYTPGSSSSKREVKATPLQRRHGHAQAHKRNKEIRAIQHNHLAAVQAAEPAAAEKRAVCDMVTATINGQVVSWLNNYGCDSPATATAAPSATPEASVAGASPSSVAAVSASENQRIAPPAATMNAGAGSWGRQAYYNAEQGVADGLVFLNHMGGQGSGVFDYTWGNSLSYASADAKTGSASPVTLSDSLLDDNSEIVVMTDKPCSGSDCGTVRPGTVAYHGFDGSSKLFLLEFSMPSSGKSGFNADMPAAWILNAAIPRTMQYGQADCSCWTSGCGEWDIFEVLDSGNDKCKSTWHGLKSMGDSNWFQRPLAATQKAAVVFDGNASTGHIVLLPAETTFDSTLSDEAVTAFVNSITDSNLSIKVALPS